MIGPNLCIKKKSFFREQKQGEKIPNSILTLFLILQLIYGLNFGFLDVFNKKLRRVCKIIYLFVCFYNGIILLSYVPVASSQWNIDEYTSSLFFVQYCGHNIVLYFAKYKVYNFISDIRKIDDGIQSKEQKIGLFACIVFGCWFVLSIIIFPVVICTVKIKECSLQYIIIFIMYQAPTTGIDAIVLVQLIVNFYTYYVIVYLVGLVGTEKISLIRKQFLRASECCEKFGGHYRNLVSIYVTASTYRYNPIVPIQV